MDEAHKLAAEISKTVFYDLLARQVQALLEGETDPIANMANVAAHLYHTMENVNWVGFYRFEQGELILGPFQGKVACVRIALGSGVCGTAAQKRETLVVPDVHRFPGHIACDSASNSEIVIPLIKNDRLLGVLDVDSPEFNRFDEEDRKGLEKVVQIFLLSTHFV